MTEFKDRLKILRGALHLKQDDMAGEIGVKLTAISKYETNVVKPGFETLSKIGLQYNVNLNWLINGYGDMLNNYIAVEKTGTDDIGIFVAQNNNKIVYENFEGMSDESYNKIKKATKKFSNEEETQKHAMALSKNIKIDYYEGTGKIGSKIFYADGSVDSFQEDESVDEMCKQIIAKLAKIQNDKEKLRIIKLAVDALE
ncbi:MAG: helix-turn-helix transcriptional regulator [Candidatus Gastranaerophilales bacterium]|nr:helix-turn-helix transcriptional regulator [Candidatus Gastranaerophilales bacterium]